VPLLGLAIGVVASLIQLGAISGGSGGSSPFAALDAAAQDQLLRAQSPEWHLGTAAGIDPARNPRNFITIVAIDERTIDELGAYNGGYPRSYYAQVVENLLAAPPRVIAFDLGFFEPTLDDAQLAAAFDHARALPLPTSIILGTVGLVPQGRTLERAADGELIYSSGLSPVPLLAARADLALANIVPDEQGTIRSMPLLAQQDGIERPTLGLAAAARYLRRPTFFDGRDSTSLQLAGRTIPLENDLALRIGYLGPPSQSYLAGSTFRVVSLVDVLRGRLNPAIWRGGLVIIGAHGATGLADDYWTPTSDQGRKMAGAEIHANVAASLFSTQFLREGSPRVVMLSIIGIAVVVALLTARLGAVAASVATCLVLVVYAAANVWALYVYGLLLPFSTPLLAGLVSFSGTAAHGRAVEQRGMRRLRAEAARAADHDTLTGLPNRQRLNNSLAELIRQSTRQAKPFGLLLLDLDRFKNVNETLGHQAGDRVLCQIALRLREAVPPEATVARLGGDEFGVLFPELDPTLVARIGERLVNVVRVPMLIQDQEVAFDVSVGAVAFPDHGDDPGTLLRHAELAMYAAKQARGGCAVYTPEQDKRAYEQLALMSALRGAVERNEMVLLYQPKLDCRSRQLVGVEALVRWRHRGLGLVGPDRFIPLAEETGLISTLTRWVVDAAVSQCRAWLDAGLDVAMAVNLSAVDAQNTDLPQVVEDTLARWGVQADRLTLELTESALLADAGRALDILGRIAALGVHISLDDFGTGYSSLGYLKRFPVRELKIDRSLVGDIVHEPRDRAIVRSTVELGHNLGLIVVAEGVEDSSTLELLDMLGCDQAQGFYIGSPMSAAEIDGLLRGRHAEAA
jgi:diguanylate cyclase (GGDEF)-like protein